MSAHDAPPGVPFAGRAAGEFVARPRPRKLAARVFFLVVAASGLTIALASRRLYSPSSELLLAVSLMCLCVAAVGYAVRRARVRVDDGGVQWGWGFVSFRMSRARVKSVAAYRDAVALKPQRGSVWYLSARDWDRFDRFGPAFRRARIPFEERSGRAPLTARLQSYGLVLDLLLIVDAVAALLALAAAAS